MKKEIQNISILKKARSYFGLFLLAIILLTSCKEEKNCLDYAANNGAIIREIDLGQCYGLLKKEFILIKDATKYNNLVGQVDDSLLVNLGCATQPPLPNIDFEEFSLIGAHTTGEGCIVSYQRNVTIDTINQIINYNIIVHQCGSCTDIRHNMNWVLIKKVNSKTNIQVNISHL